MKKNDDTQEQRKVIPIAHYHILRQPWIILPYGMYYNAELLEAREGDVLLFSDGVEREIEYITPIKSQSSFTDFFCRKTYGVSLKRIKERWKHIVEIQGHNEKILDPTKVILIFLKEIPKEEPKKK